MLYAIIDNKKTTANNTGERAKCPFTGAEMIAKCGSIKINHWAYKVASEGIDYKGETEWHLDWKSRFNSDLCEIMHVDLNGFRHIADIDTGSTVVEFQHSPIKSLELIQRELFYTSIGKNFVWVLDGSTFLSDIIVSETNYVNFTINYCSKEQRDLILEFYKGSSHVSYIIEGSKTTFYTIDLSVKNKAIIVNRLKDYQSISNVTKSDEISYNVILRSSKSIYNVSRSRICIDISHKIEDKLYDIDSKEIISKSEFIKNVDSKRDNNNSKFSAIVELEERGKPRSYPQSKMSDIIK